LGTSLVDVIPIRKGFFSTIMQQGKPLAKKDSIVVDELLPYPIVHYLGFYGIFFISLLWME
jgi:hypothetical protein